MLHCTSTESQDIAVIHASGGYGGHDLESRHSVAVRGGLHVATSGPGRSKSGCLLPASKSHSVDQDYTRWEEAKQPLPGAIRASLAAPYLPFEKELPRQEPAKLQT
jgi:hypothetical protein